MGTLCKLELLFPSSNPHRKAAGGLTQKRRNSPQGTYYSTRLSHRSRCKSHLHRQSVRTLRRLGSNFRHHMKYTDFHRRGLLLCCKFPKGKDTVCCIQCLRGSSVRQDRYSPHLMQRYYSKSLVCKADNLAATWHACKENMYQLGIRLQRWLGRFQAHRIHQLCIRP